MKVLGIVSSPRKGGNSELAVKEILSQLPASWEKEMIQLNDLNLKYCTACYSCIPEEKRCKLDDDLNFFLDKVKSADKLILAAPAYYLGAHTAMKVARDRLLSIVRNHKEFVGKDCVLAGFYGRAKGEGLLKEDMLILARKLNLNVVDAELMLATNPGDSVQGENLTIVQRLAKSLVEPPKTPVSTGTINCPYCASTAFTIKDDGQWQCSICAGGGKLELQNGKFSLKYDPAYRGYNFTTEDMDAHAQYLDEKKKLFMETRHQIKEIQAKYANIDCWVKP